MVPIFSGNSDVHLHSESTFSKIGGKNSSVKKSCLELLADVASSSTLIDNIKIGLCYLGSMLV